MHATEADRVTAQKVIDDADDAEQLRLKAIADQKVIDDALDDIDVIEEGEGADTAEFTREENFNDIMSLKTQADPRFRDIFESMTGNQATDENIASTPNDTWRSILTRAENNGTLNTGLANNYKAKLDVTPADEFVGTGITGTGEEVIDAIIGGETKTETFEGLEATGEISAGITGFTTGRGSTYYFGEDNKTIRNRAKDNENDVDYGIQSTPQKAIFMESNATLNSFMSDFMYGKAGKDIPLQFVPKTENTAELIYTTDFIDNDGNFHAEGSTYSAIGDLPYSLVPEVGMIPVEIYDSKNTNKREDGSSTGIHFGTPITGLDTDNSYE